jgi:hypothetical protein
MEEQTCWINKLSKQNEHVAACKDSCRSIPHDEYTTDTVQATSTLVQFKAVPCLELRPGLMHAFGGHMNKRMARKWGIRRQGR